MVHFNVGVDWGEQPAEPDPAGADWGSRFSLFIDSCAYVFAAPKSWKNWRGGRTDRVGAWRLAVLVSTGAFLTCLLAAHYYTVGNFNRAMSNWLAIGVFSGVLFGTMYLAL